MATLKEVEIGQRFSFQVYPTGLLGNAFNDVRMEGIMSARAAISNGVDVQSLHDNVYPTLPQGTPNDPLQYNFIKIQLANGEYTYLGTPWIRADSIVISTGGKITMVWENKTQTDLERILTALSANTLSPDSSEIVSS